MEREPLATLASSHSLVAQHWSAFKMEYPMTPILRRSTSLAAVTLMAVVAVSAVGCDTKEKVLDIETPGGEVEVERDRDTGDVEVEVNTDDR